MAPGVFQITQKAFVVDRGRLLVLHDHGTGHGDLPGGRLEPEELFVDWRVALQRELVEELGDACAIDLAPSPTFHFPLVIAASGMGAVGFAWDATWRGGAVQVSDEHSGHTWVDLTTWTPGEGFVGHLRAAVVRWAALQGAR